MGKSFRDTLKERMRDPAFLAEWNVQKQFAEITGIDQADISRLENGTANPPAEDAEAACRRNGKTAEAGVRSDLRPNAGRLRRTHP